MGYLFEVKCIEGTANLKKGQVYHIVEEGLDWYRVKAKGHLIYADKNIFKVDFEYDVEEEIREDDEEEFDEYIIAR